MGKKTIEVDKDFVKYNKETGEFIVKEKYRSRIIELLGGKNETTK